MDEILIISTGGTFNKIYNPISGELEIDAGTKALKQIADKWLCEFETKIIIGKDSLDMNESDREILLQTIQEARHQKIIVIHGTDTMDLSARHVARSNPDKTVIFTGAMVPFSIDPVEAAANLASAIGFATSNDQNGVYIAMNGVVGRYNEVAKDRVKGKFITKDQLYHK